MATIDDLVKATRSKRVQVADLPDAPKLQPTVRSGGQYTVAVQQAGRNKLMDLADALSTINPMLKDYKGIADLELEEYEAQLKRTKPEDLKAQLQKTTDQFDSMSRKGGFLEWMVSPINEVRKRRALGKAAHDQFVQGLISSEGRLNNPKEGDDKLTTAQIMKQEFDAFVEANPALQGQYANEGFTEAVNPTILAMTDRYDAQKAKQSKADTLLGNTSSIYRLAKNAKLGSAQYDIDMSKALEDWGDLNAFPPAKQIEVIQNVSEQLAKLDGGERKARQFLTWAGQNLKVGNALFHKNEDQVDRIESLIEATAEASDRLRETDREDRIKKTVAQAGVLANRIQNRGETVEYTDRNGVTKQAATVEELIKGFQMDADGDDDIEYTYEVQRELEKVLVNDVDPNQYFKNQVIRETTALKNLSSFIDGRVKLLTKEYTDIALKYPSQMTGIQLDVTNDMKAKADAEMDRLITSGEFEDPKELARSIDGFIQEQFTDLDNVIKHRFELIRTQDSAQRADEMELNQLVAEVTKVDDPTSAATENWFSDESPEDIITKATKNSVVIANKSTSPEERQKALKYNDKYIPKALNDLAKIASGVHTNVGYKREELAKRDGDKILETGVRYGRNKNLVRVAIGFPTFEEMEKAAEDFNKIAVFSDMFTDISVLKGDPPITPIGGRVFDPKQLNPKLYKLVKPELLESVKAIEKVEDVPDEIKEIADLVGVTDYLGFIRDQINLRKNVYGHKFDK